MHIAGFQNFCLHSSFVFQREKVVWKFGKKMSSTPKKKTSWVWEYMTRMNDSQVACNQCSKTLSFHGSTSSLSSHLTALHSLEDPRKPEVESPLRIRSMESFVVRKNKQVHPERAKEITAKIAEFLAIDMRPISTVEVSI